MILISIIITTKNEQKNIKNCLTSIKQQNFNKQQIEIIVVDNNSNDQTKEIARQYTNKVFNIGPERSAQRNFGARHAQGEILGFLDADMILSSSVVQEVVQKFEQDKDLIGLYINEQVIDTLSPSPQPLPSCKSFFCKLRNFERQFNNQTSIDAVRFVSRTVFEKVGGFDENLTGPEDWDFDKRIRQLGKTDILKSVIYHNELGLTLKKLLRKKKYYAGSFANYINKWGRNDSDIKKQFGLSYRYLKIFIEDGKWKRILEHPILFFGVLFLRFLVGAIYLFNLIEIRLSRFSNSS